MKRAMVFLFAVGLALPSRATPGRDQPVAQGGLPTQITVCDDDAEHPPFVYYQRQHGVRTEKLIGFAVEALRRILTHRGIAFTLELLPLKRCLASVHEGRIDMVLSTSRSLEHEKSLVFSQALYQARLVYFFNSEQAPLQVLNRNDLLNYKICIVNGANYAPFGLLSTSPNVTGSARNLGQAFRMLKSKRCEVVPARLEDAIGYRLLGLADYEQLGIGFAPMPDGPNATQSMHFAVSAKHPQAEALVMVLNEGLEQLKAAGEITELSDRFRQARLP